jgi:iron complex transport system ATP-binding protein
MLDVQKISIAYGLCVVVSEVSFSLADGKIVAILGANGAGKTTILRGLNRSVELQRGEILLDTKPLQDYSQREIARRIAVVAQEAETKFPVTVLEFVLSGRFAHGGVFGWETPEDVLIAQGALAECDLADFGMRMMNELSGGERQRVVFARALATEARILLLDEPTANLDLRHQAILFRLIREKCGEGTSAVIVTHDLNLASQFADEILLLKRGNVIAHGAAREVLTRENLGEAFAVDVFLDENPQTRNVRVTTIY